MQLAARSHSVTFGPLPMCSGSMTGRCAIHTPAESRYLVGRKEGYAWSSSAGPGAWGINLHAGWQVRPKRADESRGSGVMWLSFWWPLGDHGVSGLGALSVSHSSANMYFIGMASHFAAPSWCWPFYRYAVKWSLEAQVFWGSDGHH